MIIRKACNVILGIKFFQLFICKEASSKLSQQGIISRTFQTGSGAANFSIMLKTDDVFAEFLIAVPRLSYDRYKGQSGRVAVVGGCEEYTGAPYFAGITALKVGADLSHVICTKDAATAIKSYSPELIVHPLLDKPDGMVSIRDWLPRLHAVLVGPGLGREPSNLDVAKKIIVAVKENDVPLVIDADGVFIVSQDPSVIRGYKKAILTPNLVEFKRLFTSLNLAVEENNDRGISHDIKDTVAVSNALGGVTVVRKGAIDIIASEDEVVLVDEQGSPRRCGGQGDLLSGAMMVFSYWAHRSHKNSTSKIHPGITAAYAACLLTRKCSQEAFSSHHRSTTTTDLINAIDPVFHSTFELALSTGNL